MSKRTPRYTKAELTRALELVTKWWADRTSSSCRGCPGRFTTCKIGDTCDVAKHFLAEAKKP